MNPRYQVTKWCTYVLDVSVNYDKVFEFVSTASHLKNIAFDINLKLKTLSHLLFNRCFFPLQNLAISISFNYFTPSTEQNFTKFLPFSLILLDTLQQLISTYFKHWNFPSEKNPPGLS